MNKKIRLEFAKVGKNSNRLSPSSLNSRAFGVLFHMQIASKTAGLKQLESSVRTNLSGIGHWLEKNDEHYI